MGRIAKTDRVPRTRAGGAWTEAAFWGFLRSGLRRMSTRWPPLSNVLKVHRRPYDGPNTQQKWEYQCALCGEWFPQAVTRNGKRKPMIEVDHIDPCGTLKSFADLAVFAERLFCEIDKLRVTCVACNQSRKGSHAGVVADDE